MKLDKNAIAALEAVSKVCSEGGYRFVLIGAVAPQLLLDRGRELTPPTRPTRDIDAVVEVPSWTVFQGLFQRLQEEGFEPSRTPHRLTFAGEVSVDLLPYSAALIEGNQLLWQDTERAMSVVGFEETFQNASVVEIGPGLSVLVANIPSLVLMKIAAYMDRPRERVRDLVDIVYYFAHYDVDGNKRFDLSGLLVDDKELTYEESGAYLLGKDVRHLGKRQSLALVHEFVGRFDSEYSTPLGQILREEKRLEDVERRAFLFRLFRVFRRAVKA